MDWQEVFLWPGYGFWGLILTAIGSFTTFIFAFLANINARKATEAAISAKQVVYSVDAVAELGRILRLLKEIRFRGDNSEWQRVSELCEDVRVAIISVNTNLDDGISEDSRAVLSSLSAQMATMGRPADKAFHNGKISDLVRIKSILSKFSEEIAGVQAQIKQNVGGLNV